MIPSFASLAAHDLLNQFKKPSKQSAKSDLKLDNSILAFRTITTMLALIQCPTETTTILPVHISKPQRKELRVLDALAALLIRQYEKVAIMAKPYDGKSISVISVVNFNNPGSAVIEPASGSWAIRWLASLNSRHTQPLFPENDEDSMRVVDPDTRVHQTLEEHRNNPDKLLKTFLLTQWGTESFVTHAWMLKSLLRQSNHLDNLETLQLYVVAADFKKMLARMNHAVSSHYLACFQRVKSRTFEPIETKPYDKNDQLFLDDIPTHDKYAKTKIPNLAKMAQAANNMTPFNLYNKDTCIEFHNILCEVLESFHESLKNLKDIEKLKVKKRKEGAGINESDRNKIVEQLQKVLALGRALRAIVRGSVIAVHLATIAPFLEVRSGKFWPMAHESEDDAEFHLLKPYSTDGHGDPLLPWKSFHDWLMLMVHHFDAIHVLDNYLIEINSPGSSSPIDISIKILFPSLPDQSMLPWKQLLENEKYFPPIQHSPDQPSATELITFLSSPTLDEDGNTIKDLINYVDKFKGNEALGIATEKDYTEFNEVLTEEVNVLEESSSAGWKDYIADILRQVEVLRSDRTHDRLSRLEGISKMLENLKGSFSLYKSVQPGTSLSLGSGFIGSGHCEVFAAVSNSLSHTGPHVGLSEDLLEEFKTTGQVLGVSKRCCPVCARLLSLLKPNNKGRFLTTGNHTTISACTLPECLPQHIIDQMVVEFGLTLRKELVNLQKTTKVQRARAQTNDTRRISMDSLVLTDRERVNRNLSKALGKVA